MVHRAARWTIVLLALACAACRVAPHAADPRAPVVGVDAALVNSPRVEVRVLHVNGAEVPGKAWERALATLRHALAGHVDVVEAGRIVLPADERGALREPFTWPVFAAEELEAGRVVRRELAAGAWNAFVRDGEVVALEALDPDGVASVRPVVAQNVLLVAFVPRDADAGTLLGTCTPLYRFEAGTMERSGHSIVVQVDALRSRATWFGSAATLAEHTLVHEFGHALGLPADPARAWIGPHFGAHCTQPDCALYPALDWRSASSALLHGWPLDWCEDCRAELAAARARTSGS
ncbi:MAG: hypothetical protein U1F29_14150 [Planctomycetota bacterium]